MRRIVAAWYWLLPILLGHFLLLFNTGIYFDGWQLFDWFRNDSWTTSLEFYSRLGMPGMHYWYWAAAKITSFPLSYKIWSYLWISSGAVLAYLTFSRLKVCDRERGIWIVLLASLNPWLVTFIEPTHFCYHSGYFLFQLGCYLFVVGEQSKQLRAYLFRGAAIVCFALSFNYNALLVYYYGFWGLWLVYWWSTHHRNTTGTVLFAIKDRADFTLLPLAFWVWKQTFTPVHGDQVGYNKIEFGSAMWGPIVRLPYVVLIELREVIEHLTSLWVIPTLGIALAIVFLARGQISFISLKRTGWLAASGLFLFLCAAFPYIASVRGFSLGLNGDRMNFLLSFPIAVVIVAVFSALFRRKLWNLGRFFLGLVMVLFFAHTITRYVRWQVRTVKDEAVMFQLVEKKILDRASIFAVYDRIVFKDKWDDRYWYIGHQPSFMMAGLGGGMKWLAIPETADTFRSPYSVDEIMAFAKKFRLTYYIDQVNLKGQQARLEITHGPGFEDSVRPFGRYYYYRFFDKAKFETLMREFVTLNLR